jgi:hypothetical protein
MLADCNKAPGTTFTGLDGKSHAFGASKFFDPKFNSQVCVAKRWPNGSMCPQPNVTLDREHAGENCMSGFCAADTSACEDGFGPDFEETQGGSRNDGQSGGHDTGPLALTQASNSFVRVAPTDDTDVTDKRTYGIGVGASYGVNILGIVQFDVLDVDVKETTEKEKKKAEYDQSVSVFGIDVPIPIPDRPDSVAAVTHPLASCGSAEWNNGEWAAPDCDVALNPDGSVNPDDSIQPTAIEIPIPLSECDPKPGEPQKNCFKKTVEVGFVPITLIVEAEVSAIVEVGGIVEPKEMEPALVVAPGIGVGLSVHAGVGVEEDDGITAYAGVKADITIVEITFPVTWTLHADETHDSKGKIVEGLYEAKYTRDVGIEETFLKMAMGIFVEVGVGSVKHEWDWDLFGFDGIKLRLTLKSDDLLKTKVDFEWQP